MAATPAFGVSLVGLLLLAQMAGAPMAGAPLPLDPALSVIAPEECLWYAASAGLGPADAASANQSEQLLAEPAVQRFFAELERTVTTALRQKPGMAPEQQALLDHGLVVLKALASCPIAAYVEDVTPTPDGAGVLVDAAVVLNSGQSFTELQKSIDELLTLARTQGLETILDSSAGITWQRLGLPPGAPPVRIGWKDQYLLVAIGEKTPEALLTRMGGAPPKWLSELREEHPIAREQSLGYLNVAGILARVRPLIEAQEPQVWPALETLGVTRIKALHGVAGFDEAGVTRGAHLGTDGSREGLLAFLPHEALTADDLTPIPADATFGKAVRLNPSELLDRALKLIGHFEPRAQADFDREHAQVLTRTGINIREDVIAALGDAWVAYLPSGDLMASWLNAGGAVGVKDANKLRSAITKIITIARMNMGDRGDVAINESTYEGQTLYTLQILRAPVPIAPSWCVTDSWLHFGLSPQAVQSAMGRQAEQSLAGSEALDGVLSDGDGAAAVVYCNTRQVVQSVYPWVQMGVQGGAAALRRQGVEINPSLLPPLDVITRHLRPSVITMKHGADGFHLTHRGSLPGGGNIIAAAPVAVGLLAPAVQGARSAAYRAQESNHLKILALGVMNYESTHGRFPTDVYDEDGRPLLSWRVLILPYIEHQTLYEQFRLDEPWDSEHNRPLLDQMPEWFASPSGGGAGARTRFLALRGPATLFPGDEQLRFQDVTDGLSNTILFVHAAPEAAVEWARPADINFDAERPFAGVAHPSGAFLAAFADGSVHSLSLAIGNDQMNALATRSGEEAVGDLQAPPAPHLFEEAREAAAHLAPAEAP